MTIGIKFIDTVTFKEHMKADSRAAATYSSSWYKIDPSCSFASLLDVGDMVTSATLDMKLEQATDSSGSGVKDIKSMSQLTEAGGDGDQLAALEASYGDLDVVNGFIWLRVSFTVAVAAVECSCNFLAFWTGVPNPNLMNAAYVAEVQ